MRAEGPARPASVELLILDVDGTLRWTSVPGQRAPHAPEQWRLMPRVAAMLRRIDWSATGTRLGIASNQTDVAFGLVSESMARTLIEYTVRAALGRRPAHLSIQLPP